MHQQNYKKVLRGQPHCMIGKNGITNEFINHVINLLKRYKIIKIKALKSVVNKSNIKLIASQISEATNSYLLDVRGFTFIISKSLINKNH